MFTLCIGQVLDFLYDLSPPFKCRLHVPIDRLALICYPLDRETSQNNAIPGRNLLAILTIPPTFYLEYKSGTSSIRNSIIVLYVP
jgi:hypothetical protein